MPFESTAQRGWMYANHPAMAKRWEAHTPKGKHLPEHKHMPQQGTHTAKSEDHASGEGKHNERAKGKGPSVGDGAFKQKSKSRYNMATHTMSKPKVGQSGPVKQTDASGSKSGFSGRTSRVRALEPHEHRAAAAVLHQAGHIHAAAHHTAAADHMEGQHDEDGAGNVGEARTGQPKGQRAGSRVMTEIKAAGIPNPPEAGGWKRWNATRPALAMVGDLISVALFFLAVYLASTFIFSLPSYWR